MGPAFLISETVSLTRWTAGCERQPNAPRRNRGRHCHLCIILRDMLDSSTAVRTGTHVFRSYQRTHVRASTGCQRPFTRERADYVPIPLEKPRRVFRTGIGPRACGSPPPRLRVPTGYRHRGTTPSLLVSECGHFLANPRADL